MNPGWWHNMPLDAWCEEPSIGSGDFAFAMAVANERARKRGVRQRVARNRGEAHEVFSLVVADVERPRLRSVAS